MSAPAAAPRVVLYGRPGCHLCDEARSALTRLKRSGHAFELHEVDIESDQELHRRLLERIPVIELDGRVVSELDDGVGPLVAALAGPGTVSA